MVIVTTHPIVKSILKAGFILTHDTESGVVWNHPNFGVFSTLEEAVIACIEVATES